MRRALRTIPTTIALLLVAGGVAAQSVSEVVDQMYASYERQARGVDDYTLVQTAMGIQTTSYFVKEMVDGRPVFRLQGAAAQETSFSFGGSDAGFGDIYDVGPQLEEHARYVGREEVEGSAVHVLAVDDLSQLDLAPTAPGEMEFEPRTGRFFVDAELLVPRRIELVGDAVTPNGTHEVTVTIDFRDIREEQGLLIPYQTSVSLSGLQAMIDPATRAQLEEVEAQLAALPPDQREMMERMMGPQLEQIRAIAAGGSDVMSVDVSVDEVLVNSGPPAR